MFLYTDNSVHIFKKVCYLNHCEGCTAHDMSKRTLEMVVLDSWVLDGWEFEVLIFCMRPRYYALPNSGIF